MSAEKNSEKRNIWTWVQMVDHIYNIKKNMLNIYMMKKEFFKRFNEKRFFQSIKYSKKNGFIFYDKVWRCKS